MVLTPVAIAAATRAGVLDLPGGHKRHESPVPYLGGLAIVVAFAASILGAVLFAPPESGEGELVIVLLLALGLAIVGIADDLRNLSPLVRLVVEVLCAVALWHTDVRITLTGETSFDVLLTVLWVVGITNAFNLLDNMDGLAAGQASICSVAVFVIAATNGQFLVAGLAISLAGCAAGFLRHNFHPARIYMGDGGALFLGFLIAYLGIKLRFADSVSGAFLVPVVICILPITDTTLVTLSRLVAGRSPFQGGQDHVSHRMVQSGIPVPVSVGLTYFASIAAGLLAYVISRVDQASAWVLFGFVVTTAVAAALLLALVPVYPNSRLRHFVIEERTEAT
ncbi:MAG: MraY family glycosyltransferase [Acidimicrobiales bacterium]|nr:MraY family glycosyltransferase [Acidimicrobiales bacterium]